MQTPGVFIEEIPRFPDNVAQVETAIPAFVGYTPSAKRNGESVINELIEINSWLEFVTIYGFPEGTSECSTQLYLREQENAPIDGHFIQIGLAIYAMIPDYNTLFYTYESVKLYFQNGGSTMYMLSVGTYLNIPSNPHPQLRKELNENVLLEDLLKGVQLLKSHSRITMYLCPEATLLSKEENGSLMQAMLLQQETLKTGICILDVKGGRTPDPIMYTEKIQDFRDHTGTRGLKYGAAYFPFVETTVIGGQEINYTNFFGNSLKKLSTILYLDLDGSSKLDSILAGINEDTSNADISSHNDMLLAVSPFVHKNTPIGTSTS